MAHRSIADELVSILAQAGVERRYGIVGDSLNPVTDAVRRSGKIQWVHVRHEENGAFAAGAEAQSSGKLVACAGSCGPGNLHLINGSMTPTAAWRRRHGRYRDVQRLVGAVPRGDEGAADACLGLARLDGERPSAGDRRAASLSGSDFAQPPATT
jgi:hypothetical protein